jgi:hypothetical protein
MSISTRFWSPTAIPGMASSRPGMIWPEPTVNSSGSRPEELSNTVPSVSVPV